tara:strand:- start:946 stop:1311 length:366 start_codon:yes stop_codon:yes gene_type:complete
MDTTVDAIESLLNRIEDIKQTLPDSVYIGMLEDLQTIHTSIKPREPVVEDIYIDIERMHLGDEYLYNLIRNIVGRRTMNAGHLNQILLRKGYSAEIMGYASFKDWMEDLHIHIVDNNIVFP